MTDPDNTTSQNKKIYRIVLLAVMCIFLVLPFTTPLAVFLGSHLNQLTLFKIWKELAIAIICVLVLFRGVLGRFTNIKQHLLKVLLWLIIAYSAWTILLGAMNLFILDQINWEAFSYALVVNLRFLFFFILCWLISQNSSFLITHWKKILLIPAAVVIGFGLLQHFVLPNDVLTHIGYGPDTTTPYQTVDQKPDYVRVQSTLRGPNPLGVYLILVIIALLALIRKAKWYWAALLAGAVIVMFYSYSRSAWLGLVAAVAVFLYVSIANPLSRKRIILAGLTALLIFSAGAFLARDNPFVQNALLHTDTTSTSPQSSNEQRAEAMARGAIDVIHEPLGRGPGSAGPASLRNDQPERIAENYYLQIGQELGWIGLLLFLAINIVISILLWRKRTSALARVLLASLVGITIANLLSHAWADDTLSLVWWGLAGIALAPTILPQKTKEQQGSSRPEMRTLRALCWTVRRGVYYRLFSSRRTGPYWDLW